MFHIPGKFSVLKCNNCSIAFLNPRPSFRELQKYYPTKRYYAYNENKKGFFSFIREYLIKHYYAPTIVSKIISVFISNVPAMPTWKNSGKILDVGCGTGETLQLLKRLGWDVYGIDIDRRAIKIARQKGLSRVEYGAYQHLSTYPDHFFDAIRLYHVIEHLDNPQECLRIIAQKLKIDGEIIIGTPNVESIVARIFKHYWYNLDSPRHLILFSANTLRKILKKEGYLPNEVRFCSAGGMAGSMQYVLFQITGRTINLINNTLFVLLIYPFEWIFDRLKQGDILIVRAKLYT
ncbi:hypothetical protein A2973_00690 [Candidatus Gottesmanbacteria bacterium RIFCSPLOWO2_01_FULL_49_10]|uniref:Methyltransferase type 11 domain-containing protein n=1 Tax=Candidatus Gottesmanbacteria bacterium RIFCSPLOWO2_01_FULL_49_10 TaxID=1798396 RepID=A0A1F6AX48_9BACT|nr:MAG: hypothetical protein A2973_00690 [Candidatus Gottesmanbacteria bacterium RIFCSPLOWO2_01_FULL_49_10]